ncbi:MAG: hypothetical protein ACRD4B_01760 [Acidobacteriota bacterium]
MPDEQKYIVSYFLDTLTNITCDEDVQQAVVDDETGDLLLINTEDLVFERITVWYSYCVQKDSGNGLTSD